MIKSILVIILCLILSSCKKVDTIESTNSTLEEQTTENYSLDIKETDTPQISEPIPTETVQHVGFSQNEYMQFIEKTEPSIINMDLIFYEEIDADEDGNIEIIASYGQKSKDIYGDDSIEASFVLRYINGSIQLVKQNFCNETGYNNNYMQLAQFTGSNRYYIVVGVTNYVNMNGIDIYEITDKDVIYLGGGSSPAGVCDAYLSNKKSDGKYGGFSVELYSYDVLYYNILTFYEFKNGTFKPQDSKVDVGDYPETPTDIVVQYLTLKCLQQRYSSYDILNRIYEIGSYGLYMDINYDDWNIAIHHYSIGIDSTDADEPYMTVDETITGSSAKVTVGVFNINHDIIKTTVFDLIFENGKWNIYDFHETVQIKSNSKPLEFSTFDVDKKYYESGGFAELDLKLPKLNGEYKGIASINKFFVDKENFFYSELDVDTLKSDELSANSIKGKESNWYRSAYYKFETRIGDIISISAYLDGGAGGVGWAGIEGDVFDLNTGKKLELLDIFKVSEEEYLNFIYNFVADRIFDDINKALKADYGNPYFVNDPHSETDYRKIREYFNTNDFYLTDDALVIFYQKYALTAGASGPQVFEIPYDAILNILAIDINNSL